jgi:polysaccharide export outer membrane protein
MNQNLTKTLILLSSMILASCVTNKDLTYLQYIETPPDTLVSVTPSAYKVLPYDNLFIRVVTPDPQWSNMFNTLPMDRFGVSVTEQSADLISYTVDSTGAIEIPYAGKIQVSGKTLQAITADVEMALRGFISDAAVTIKLINNYVSLVGEIERPGRYPIYKERMNIFQALAMGNDLNDFSDRQKLQLIRSTHDGTIVKEFDITDISIISNEYFYVLPNDVIYAKPIKGRFFRLNEFPYSYLLSTLTLVVLIYGVIRP